MAMIDAPIVIRPSLAAYTNTWVRNLSLPAVGVVIFVVGYRMIRAPRANGLILVLLAAFALFAVLFFLQAKIVFDGNQLVYRRLIIGRHFSLSRVGGMAIRRVELRSNRYAKQAPPYAIVYDVEKKALFSFSAALWPAADLERLQQRIGGNVSDIPVGANQLQKEFPGALPRWLVFVDSHPVLTMVIGVPLALVVIVAGIVLWDLLTTGKP
jgi:hypothetical protein